MWLKNMEKMLGNFGDFFSSPTSQNKRVRIQSGGIGRRLRSQNSMTSKVCSSSMHDYDERVNNSNEEIDANHDNTITSITMDNTKNKKNKERESPNLLRIPRVGSQSVQLLDMQDDKMKNGSQKKEKRIHEKLNNRINARSRPPNSHRISTEKFNSNCNDHNETIGSTERNLSQMQKKFDCNEEFKKNTKKQINDVISDPKSKVASLIEIKGTSDNTSNEKSLLRSEAHQFQNTITLDNHSTASFMNNSDSKNTFAYNNNSKDKIKKLDTGEIHFKENGEERNIFERQTKQKTNSHAISKFRTDVSGKKDVRHGNPQKDRINSRKQKNGASEIFSEPNITYQNTKSNKDIIETHQKQKAYVDSNSSQENLNLNANTLNFGQKTKKTYHCVICNTFFTQDSNFARHKKSKKHGTNKKIRTASESILSLLESKIKYRSLQTFIRVYPHSTFYHLRKQKRQTFQQNNVEAEDGVRSSVSNRCEICKIDFENHQQYCEHLQSKIHMERSLSSLFCDTFLASANSNDTRDITAPSSMTPSSIVDGNSSSSKFNYENKALAITEQEKVDGRIEKEKEQFTKKMRIQRTQAKIYCDDCDRYFADQHNYKSHLKSKGHHNIKRTRNLLYQAKYEDFTEYDSNQFPINVNTPIFILNVEEYERINRPKRKAPSLFPFEVSSPIKKAKLEEVQIPSFRLAHFNPSRHDNPEDLSRIYQEMLNEEKEKQNYQRKDMTRIDHHFNPSSQLQAISTLMSKNRRSVRLVEANSDDLDIDI